MTLDASVLIAILFEESGYLDLVDRILAADQVRVGTPTLVETCIVCTGRGRTNAVEKVEGLLQELGVTVVPFGEREWYASVAAALQFGRGRHPARLNFGDCMSYAVAAVANDSLMFLGDDFSKTDITAA